MRNSGSSRPAKPIKILYCIDTLVRGGTELQLIGLIERLDPEKFEPYLLTIRPTDLALTPKNCKHLAWDIPKLLSPHGIKATWRLARWLKQEKIDIVQTFFQDSTVFGGVAARLAGVTVRIASFRDLGFWSSRKQSFLMRATYPLMNAYLCNAEIVRDHFTKHFAIAPAKIRIIRNGIEVGALPVINHSGAVRHIGIVGNMTRMVKRTDLFIRAAGIVAQQHPDITWHIIGDGHMRDQLKQLAQDCNVVEKMVFAGRVAKVAQYLEQMDIGVICSDSEGLSNAILEYMFKGVTTVATAVGGNPELIEDGVSGLLVPPDNANALADALTRLIENDTLRATLANRARAKVEAEYSWEKCLADHHNYYCDLLQQHLKSYAS